MRWWILVGLLVGGCYDSVYESYTPPMSEEMITSYLACVVLTEATVMEGGELKRVASRLAHRNWTWPRGTYPPEADVAFLEACYAAPLHYQYLAQAYVRHLRDGSLEPLPQQGD